MALSKSEIQRRSDEKRGVKNKVLKMKIEDIDFLEQLAKESSMPQVAIVVEVLMLWAEKTALMYQKIKGMLCKWATSSPAVMDSIGRA